jgi:hypothetical protein
VFNIGIEFQPCHRAFQLHFSKLSQSNCQISSSESALAMLRHDNQNIQHSPKMQHPTSRPTFLGLPPELRNSIYKFMLTNAEPLHVAFTFPPPRHHPNVWIKLVRTPDNEGPVGGSNMLRTSKLTHQEARSILYGSNVFLFMEPQTLRIFASSIGDNKAILRHVRLKIGRSNTMRAALKALYPTPKLHTLDLGRFLDTSNPRRMLVQLHRDEEMREAAVAFADAGQTVDECEERFAATRICAIMKVSRIWELVIE